MADLERGQLAPRNRPPDAVLADPTSVAKLARRVKGLRVVSVGPSHALHHRGGG
jgi:hypothetical protein